MPCYDLTRQSTSFYAIQTANSTNVHLKRNGDRHHLSPSFLISQICCRSWAIIPQVSCACNNVALPFCSTWTQYSISSSIQEKNQSEYLTDMGNISYRIFRPKISMRFLNCFFLIDSTNVRCFVFYYVCITLFIYLFIMFLINHSKFYRPIICVYIFMFKRLTRFILFHRKRKRLSNSILICLYDV